MKAIVRKLTFFAGQIIRFIYYSYLRMNGIKIGNNTFISLGAKLDTQFGKIVIGDNVHITSGCVLLAHDGAIKQMRPDANPRGKIVIGNNVFIGVNTVVLMNVTIGDNSVIGAASVVNKDIPANVLAIGNPVKIVKEI
ncbi:acyltransferase [Psychroserpens mesophilus]|uniref:acyltransferase n=1 Tax=Psychroserpens mesophilus TaxID=325473 RepID=UPI003D65E359